MRKVFSIILLTLVVVSAYSQLENPYIRRGNRLYKKQKYPQAEAQYSLALKKNPNSYIAKNNLGITYFKENNDTSALATLNPLVGINFPNPLYRSEAMYNLGDVLTKIAADSLQVHNMNGAIKYLEKAVRSYRNSVKFNPDDYQARYNLWVTQKLLDSLKQQRNQGGGGKNNQQNKNQQKNNNNQNKNQQKKNNQQNKNQQQNNSQNKDKQQQNQQNPQDKQNQQQKQFQGLDQKEIDRMLRAVAQQDKKVQQKALRNLMRKPKRKRTDKNW